MKWLVLLLLLTSCGKGLETAIPGIDYNYFDPSTQSILEESFTELFLKVKLARHVSVYAVHNGYEAGVDDGEACVNCPNCWININVDRDDWSELTGALWHEYGHCAGLGHTVEHGVMYPINDGMGAYWPYQIQNFIDAVNFQQRNYPR
jgi:hypothetical protein